MKSKNIKIIVIIAAVAALCLFCRECGIRSVMKKTGSDTTIVTRTDTINKDIIKPVVVIKNNNVVEWKHDTLEITTTVIENSKANDYNPVTNDCDSLFSLYTDKVIYKDSSVGSNWKVLINDTVQYNRLQGRKIVHQNIDTTIRTTTTLKRPGKFVLYWTLSNRGNANNVIYSQGAGLALKTPGDHVYQFEIIRTRGQKTMFGGTLYFPIRFNKNKK